MAMDWNILHKGQESTPSSTCLVLGCFKLLSLVLPTLDSSLNKMIVSTKASPRHWKHCASSSTPRSTMKRLKTRTWQDSSWLYTKVWSVISEWSAPVLNILEVFLPKICQVLIFCWWIWSSHCLVSPRQLWIRSRYRWVFHQSEINVSRFSRLWLVSRITLKASHLLVSRLRWRTRLWWSIRRTSSQHSSRIFSQTNNWSTVKLWLVSSQHF